MKQALRIILPFVCLLVTICIVTFSYAAFSTNALIGIGGTIKKWHQPVYVSRVSFKNMINATENYNPEYAYKNFALYVTLNKASKVKYNVIIKNETNTDYKITKQSISKTNNNVVVDKSSLNVGDIIPANSQITIVYSLSTSEETSQTDVIRVAFDWEVNSVTYPTITYDSSIDVEELSIGNEKFYVIERDASNVTAIAKDNLYVGKIYNNGVLSNSITSYDDGYNIQNINDLGTTKYSNNNLSGSNGAYVLDSNTLLYTYVQNYVGYISNRYSVTVNGSLISANQLNSLGCNITIGDNDNTNDSCNNAPSWIGGSTYWTATADAANKAYVVNSNKTISSIIYNNETDVGVRPIITIPTASVTIESSRP